MADWKKINSFIYPQDAYLAKALLEAEGITVFLQDEMTTQIVNFYSNALGGVKMLVPNEQAEKATQLLRDGGYLDDSPEKQEEKISIITLDEKTDKKKCPFCNSTNISQEKKPNWLTIGFIFLIGLILPITSKTYVCFDCEKKWRFK